MYCYCIADKLTFTLGKRATTQTLASWLLIVHGFRASYICTSVCSISKSSCNPTSFKGTYGSGNAWFKQPVVHCAFVNMCAIIPYVHCELHVLQSADIKSIQNRSVQVGISCPPFHVWISKVGALIESTWTVRRIEHNAFMLHLYSMASSIIKQLH